MASAETGATLLVSVAYSPRAGEVDVTEFQVPAGATAAFALRASGLLQRHPGIDAANARIGIWGKNCPPDAPLCDADRVEVYMPLQVDPKEARRLRYRSQRARKATERA